MQVEFTSVFDPAREKPEKDSGFPVAALLRHAALLEDAELDRLQITSRDPKGAKAAFLVLENTPSLGALLSHRVDDLSPQSAAEQFGLFDQLSRGRLALRIEPPSAVAHGEKHNAHELTYEILDEYLTLLRRFWVADHPFDFEGLHHRVNRGHVAAKPFRRAGVPIILGGRSGTAIQVAARHADVFALNPAPVAELRREVARFRAAAIPYGRSDSVTLSLPVRTIIGETRDKALAHARTIKPINAESANEQRIVGTVDQVALQFIELVDIGISSFVLHGLQDEAQFAAFTRLVLPLVRASAARQEARIPHDLVNSVGPFGYYLKARPLIS